MTKIYQFLNDGEEWFYGTIEQCDNCFGLRINATEDDVLDFAKSQKSLVNVLENGNIVKTFNYQ
jgi:hypothetical protein